MPVYEYYCKACDHEWEKEQRISEAPLKSCPSCKSRQAKRMISRTSFVLKGSGWYSDLYSSSGAKQDEAKTEGGAAAEKSGDKADKATKSDDSSKSAKSDDKSKTKSKGPKAAA